MKPNHGHTPDQRRASGVGTDGMVGPRLTPADLQAAAAQTDAIMKAIDKFAEENGLTFLDVIRLLAESPDERQPGSNNLDETRPRAKDGC